MHVSCLCVSICMHYVLCGQAQYSSLECVVHMCSSRAENAFVYVCLCECCMCICVHVMCRVCVYMYMYVCM